MGEVTVRQSGGRSDGCDGGDLAADGGAADASLCRLRGVLLQGGAGMTGVMGEILEHYGQTVTLRSRDGEKSVRAFIQPAAARDETVPGEQTLIGWIDERLWRYTGLEEVQPGGYRYLEGTKLSGAKQPGTRPVGRDQSLVGLAGAGAEGGGMKELSQIRKAVLEALRGAGIQAMEAFPEKQAMAYSGVVAAVGVGAASGKTAGFCHYLGEMKDPETQAVRERYGKELFGQITVELRANRAADCERGCETATEVLLGGLPEGVRTGELTWEAICWEKTTGMFLRRGVLECRALFLAESAVESGEFLDFRLKGVMSE